MSKHEILLVEDNQDDITLTLHALKGHSIVDTIKVISDGEEVLDYLFAPVSESNDALKNKPKVVFLDINLPKLTGIEILEAIRADSRTRMMPVVMLTSSHQEADVTGCYSKGANSYIVKPIDFSCFTDIIKQAGVYWKEINLAPYQN